MIFEFLRRTQNSKGKISCAVRNIEIHRRELQSLREKLEVRRRELFECALQAFEEKSETRALVYGNEHSELDNVVQTVATGELALTQLNVRLESIKDIDDMVRHMTSAFNTVKKIGRNASELVPALEDISEQVNSTISETLTQLGNVSPILSIDSVTSNGAEIVESAKKYTSKNISDLSDLPPILATERGGSLLGKVDQVAMLTSGKPLSQPTSNRTMNASSREKVERSIYEYCLRHNENLNVNEAAMILDIPPDDVERTILKLASEGKIRCDKGLEA